MSHLIQSIDIEGTRYCVKHGATTPKWRTVSFLEFLAELVGAEDDDAWRLEDGTLSFTTCCLWKATLRFSNIDSEYYGDGFFALGINGESVAGDVVVGSESVDIVVDLNDLGLMGRACGNYWQMYAVAVIVEIIDVTFGPPV